MVISVATVYEWILGHRIVLSNSLLLSYPTIKVSNVFSLIWAFDATLGFIGSYHTDDKKYNTNFNKRKRYSERLNSRGGILY